MASNRMIRVGSTVVCAFVALFASRSSAVLVSYDDRATFDLDAPGSDLVDFQFTGTPLEVTGSGFLMQPDPFEIPDYEIDINGLSKDLYLLGPDFATGATVGLTINGPYNTADGTTYLKSGVEAEFLFAGGGVTAFGIDVFTLLDPSSPLGVEVYAESVGGDPLFEDEFPLDSFVGFVSDEPIALITFTLVGPFSEGENALGFDNMSFIFAAGCTVPGDCDDGNECTDDDCVANACEYTNNANMCDDGDACTENDNCVDGMCGGTPIDCGFLTDQCNVGVCNSMSGMCEALPTNEGGMCSDGNDCTTTDTCTGGVCGGTPVDCAHLNDQCNIGVCNSMSGMCEALPTNEGGTCSDGNNCTTTDTCAGGVCGGTPVDCSHLNDPCNVGVCNPMTGMCEAQPNNEGGTCSDGNNCTTTDTCTGGVCGGTNVDCSAFNDACNIGVCNPMSGLCVAQPTNENGPCNDSNACSLGDHCVTGACQSTSNVDCTGLNTVCRTFSCLPGGSPGNCSVVTPQTGLPCNDGNLCTIEDECTPAGECAGQQIPGCVPVDPVVPTVSQWGLFVLLLGGLSMGTITFGRRGARRSSAG